MSKSAISQKYKFCGSFQYPAYTCRPDLVYATRVLASSQATTEIINACKHMVRYLRHGRVLQYTPGDFRELRSRSDSDFAEEGHRFSISGVVVTLGGNPVMWLSKAQSIVASNVAEAEIMANDKAWTCSLTVEKLYRSLFGERPDVPVLEMDSEATVKFNHADEPTKSQKHVDMRYCRVRNAIKRGHVTANWIPRAENA